MINDFCPLILLMLCFIFCSWYCMLLLNILHFSVTCLTWFFKIKYMFSVLLEGGCFLSWRFFICHCCPLFCCVCFISDDFIKRLIFCRYNLDTVFSLILLFFLLCYKVSVAIVSYFKFVISVDALLFYFICYHLSWIVFF